jgi:RHS repeat-associated protein
MRHGRMALAKEWAYDASGEVTRKDHSLNGPTSYTYDPLGRICYAAQDAQREMFHWDGAANLVDSVQPGGYVRHNRVMVFQDRRFEYDVHGRLQSKRRGAHTEQLFSYDGEHRLSYVETRRQGVTQQVRFDYDALGRRIRKHDEFGTTLFLWNGLSLLQEQRGTQAATYVYEAHSYIPVARIDSAAVAKDLADSGATHIGVKRTTYYFHCDISGLPEELTAASGEIAWRAQYKVWGNTITENWTAEPADAQALQESPLAQNLRFQGQYQDRESGLHYNAFRYYDPDIGHFTTPDPIGLAGGSNLHAYAPNPIRWMDPWGLTYKSVDFAGSPELFPVTGTQRNIIVDPEFETVV